MIQVLTGSHRRFARHSGPSGSPLRARRRPLVPDAHQRTLRRHPDVADRHLGCHRRRRVQPLGERPLHDGGLARRALPPDADGRLQRVQVVRAGYVSETSRLLALGIAALIDRGIADPLKHMLLVSRGAVATLLVSPSPFTDSGSRDDRARRGRRGVHDPGLAVDRRRDDVSSIASPGAGRRPMLGSGDGRSEPRLHPAHRRPAVLLQHAQAAQLRAGAIAARRGRGVAATCYATTTLVVLFGITRDAGVR